MGDSLPHDDIGSLERARERLYAPESSVSLTRPSLAAAGEHTFPHAWTDGVRTTLNASSHKHVRAAGIFFLATIAFFILALGLSAYLLYFGGNAVSVNNLALTLEGPTTIVGGDTVPLSVSITNRNSVAIQNATLEVDFPAGTRSADNILTEYPRYVENLGTLAPGQTITRSVKAVVFGDAAQSVSIPVSFSYSTAGSNAVFVKKTSYALAISTTPLSISVEAPAETVSGQLFTLVLTARSNAAAPLANVLVQGAFPFGFSVASSSIPLQGSFISLGTLKPGDSRTVRITGSLVAEDAAERVFRFTIGTSGSSVAPVLAVSYMEQDASITLTAPFISTTLGLNGDNSGNTVVAPGAHQSVTLSYTNTLATAVTNVSIAVALSGGAIDYNSIQSNNGFYQSGTRTILFSKDTDPALASLAPGASGLGTFTFSTLSANSGARDPLITFTTSVSGTRIGQTNVPESVNASSVATAKVTTALTLTAIALHASGPLGNSGPLPPVVGSATTYTIVWQIRGGGNAAAGTGVSATLPSYISYTSKTNGAGSLSYDSASRTVTWNAGDIPAGALMQTAFQVSLTPSSSQRGQAPALTSTASLTGFDRYAQVQLTGQAAPPTTETSGDPGYVATNAAVQ